MELTIDASNATGARQLSEYLHQHQTDWAGRPYHLHCVEVMENLGDDASTIERIAALLHDTLEDVRLDRVTGAPVKHDDPKGREMTAADLRALGVPDEAISLIEMVTRRPGQPGSYMDKIRALASSGNRSAIRLKLADNRANSDPGRDHLLPPDALARAVQMREGRYRRSMAILEAALA